MSLQAVCFVDMPFGKKADLASGVEVQFDQIYSEAIRPAIVDCGLEPVGGDQERSGGIIHAPMLGRLLLSDYVVADLTLGNPNVFYELGSGMRRGRSRRYRSLLLFMHCPSMSAW